MIVLPEHGSSYTEQTFSLQLRIQAQDGGFPPKLAVQPASLLINVIRNKFTPQFSQALYTANIRMNLGFGNRVVQVQAADDDPEVSTFLCKGPWSPKPRHTSDSAAVVQNSKTNAKQRTNTCE